MLNINTNLSSLIVQSNLKTSTNKLNQAIERLTTGFKINHAKDNAANYSISTKLSSQISAYEVAEDNALAGLDLLTTATENLDLIQSHMQRLRDLAEQVNNGTYGEDSLNAINAEANAIVDEINRIYENAEYNGQKLFATAPTAMENTIATLSLAAEPMLLSAEPATVAESSEIGFIQEVEHKDTSFAIALSTIEEGAELDSNTTYSISSAEDLLKLQTVSFSMPHCNLILANDIDMSSIDNWGGLSLEQVDSFDGNGYVISNLTGSSGLFSQVELIYIYDLGLENVDIVGNRAVGALVNFANNIDISNCYVTGSVTNSYSGSCTGSLVGDVISWGDATITDTISSVTVEGTEDVGGFIGCFDDDDDDAMGVNLLISNSQYLGESESLTGVFVGTAKESDDCIVTIENSVYNNYYDSIGIPLLEVVGDVSVTVNNVNSIEVSRDTGGSDSDSSGIPPTISLVNGSYAPEIVKLQIGSGNGEYSQLSFNIKFSLEGLEDLRNIGFANAGIATFGLRAAASPIGDIALCDEILKTIQEKQVEFGATQNRLESVLEEISIKYENLVSTRSTIQDADIAEESSAYIRSQILQQASATLLATANQTPSIALQLL